MGVNLAVRGMDRGFCSFFNILSHFVCGYQQKKVSLSQFFRRVMRLRMAYYIIWCLSWLWLVGCSGRPSERMDGEIRLVDSLLAIYKDSMAESPRQVIEVFSATRSRLHDSLDYYNLLSHESRCYYYLNQMDEAFRVNGQVITYCERNALADRNRIRIL